METTGKKHTKKLDTLIDDMNGILSGISSGKAPEVKEEQIDKFLNNTKLALLDWLQPRKIWTYGYCSTKESTSRRCQWSYGL
jgi:hypothetical protein